MGSHRDKLSGLSGLRLTIAAACAATALPALAADCPTGRFRAQAGPDVASGLEIEANGHFRYFLAAGALDEMAEGRWTCAKGILRLTTQPQPKPAEFKLDKITQDGEAPFSLIVTWPNGNGVAAVDFRIEFDKGDPVTDYTQDYGWSLNEDGSRTPKTVQFSEPFHGTISPVFPVAPGKNVRIHVILVPNDLGTVDFRETQVTQADGKLLLHWRGGEIPYAPERE